MANIIRHYLLFVISVVSSTVLAKDLCIDFTKETDGQTMSEIWEKSGFRFQQRDGGKITFKRDPVKEGAVTTEQVGISLGKILAITFPQAFEGIRLEYASYRNEPMKLNSHGFFEGDFSSPSQGLYIRARPQVLKRTFAMLDPNVGGLVLAGEEIHVLKLCATGRAGARIPPSVNVPNSSPGDL